MSENVLIWLAIATIAVMWVISEIMTADQGRR
jgi:hypothetical protein